MSAISALLLLASGAAAVPVDCRHLKAPIAPQVKPEGISPSGSDKRARAYGSPSGRLPRVGPPAVTGQPEFPGFVSDLIGPTFKSIGESNNEQLEEFSETLGKASRSDNQVRADKVIDAHRRPARCG